MRFGLIGSRKVCAFARVWMASVLVVGAAAQAWRSGQPAPGKAEHEADVSACPALSVQPGTTAQINPACELRSIYPVASDIGLALAVVPGPTVPRYRRIYDLSIQAIELGMLRDGYVLDRYYLPWRKGGQGEPASKSASGDRDAAKEIMRAADIKRDLPRGTFGLMTFRCDGWRGQQCGYPGVSSDNGTMGAAVALTARTPRS